MSASATTDTLYLLSLTHIRFKGASEYLEEIWARIDAPRLRELDMTFFNQIIFDTATLPVRQSKTDAKGTGTGPYHISFQVHYCRIPITDI
jgi:hypothetical protein